MQKTHCLLTNQVLQTKYDSNLTYLLNIVVIQPKNQITN